MKQRHSAVRQEITKKQGRKNKTRRAKGTSIYLARKRAVKKIIIFLAKLNLFSIPLYAAILSGFQWTPLMEITTQITLAFLQATGIETTMLGNLITIPVNEGSFGAFVSWDSTGWKSMLALLALMFATEFPMRKKLSGLALLPVVYALNIIRIWFMFFISTVSTRYFELAHLTVWSWGMIFAVLGLWILWMKKL